MATNEAFAPAKINLTLHITGQRQDGYHLLDSMVAFADVGDMVRVTPADEMSLTVSGPFSAGVPADDRNLCWKAAEAYGETVAIELIKNLPPAAGIGGGSSDAAAVLRAMEQAFGRPFAKDPIILGADVPVCVVGHMSQMQGIGDWVLPLFVEEPIPAVLVNPRVEVSTAEVFSALENKSNPAMTEWPMGGGPTAAMDWYKSQRNDLQEPAIQRAPVIAEVLKQIAAQDGCGLARMSGSGATCFGLFHSPDEAEAAANAIAASHPGWWVVACAMR